MVYLEKEQEHKPDHRFQPLVESSPALVTVSQYPFSFRLSPSLSCSAFVLSFSVFICVCDVLIRYPARCFFLLLIHHSLYPVVIPAFIPVLSVSLASHSHFSLPLFAN